MSGKPKLGPVAIDMIRGGLMLATDRRQVRCSKCLRAGHNTVTCRNRKAPRWTV